MTTTTRSLAASPTSRAKRDYAPPSPPRARPNPNPNPRGGGSSRSPAARTPPGRTSSPGRTPRRRPSTPPATKRSPAPTEPRVVERRRRFAPRRRRARRGRRARAPRRRAPRRRARFLGASKFVRSPFEVVLRRRRFGRAPPRRRRLGVGGDRRRRLRVVLLLVATRARVLRLLPAARQRPHPQDVFFPLPLRLLPPRAHRLRPDRASLHRGDDRLRARPRRGRDEAKREVPPEQILERPFFLAGTVCDGIPGGIPDEKPSPPGPPRVAVEPLVPRAHGPAVPVDGAARLAARGDDLPPRPPRRREFDRDGSRVRSSSPLARLRGARVVRAPKPQRSVRSVPDRSPGLEPSQHALRGDPEPPLERAVHPPQSGEFEPRREALGADSNPGLGVGGEDS